LNQGSIDPDERAEILEDRSLHWLLHPPRVAIIGIPNVGKSTLANQLFAQERSITADLPGTTRDWVGEIANLDGLAVMLVDTPGLRETHDPIEREAIARSREVVSAADLVVLVLDPTQPREPGQAALERADPGALRVLNKSDRIGGWQVDEPVLHTVATTGRGIDALRTAIREHFLGPAPFDVSRPRCWTERQRSQLLHQQASP
jgi:tRNA modification GTPase